MKEECPTCKFCYGGTIAGMTCRRNPPMVMLAPTPQGIALMSHFPPVKEGMSCGEYKVNPFMEDKKP